MKKKSILFADDEFAPDNATTLGSYMSYYSLALSDAGFDVIQAVGADQALGLLAASQFDLAILDVMMPPGDALRNEDTMDGAFSGAVLAQRIHSEFPGLPIFLLSNANTAHELLISLHAGGVVCKVLSKLEVTPIELADEAKNFFTGGDGSGARN